MRPGIRIASVHGDVGICRTTVHCDARRTKSEDKEGAKWLGELRLLGVAQR